MTTTDQALDWLRQFQTELNDDIDHGAKRDLTRKPSTYVIVGWEYAAAPDGDADEYIFDNYDDENTAEEMVQLLLDDDVVQTIYDAINNNGGLTLDSGSPYVLNEIDIDELRELEYDNPDEFNRLKAAVKLEQSCFTSRPYEELAEYVNERGFLDYRLCPVRRESHNIDGQFFFTRKSGERFLAKHGNKYHENDKRVYAEYSHRNDEYMRVMAFLSALDLDRSHIVINQDRYDTIKDRA